MLSCKRSITPALTLLFGLSLYSFYSFAELAVAIEYFEQRKVEQQIGFTAAARVGDRLYLAGVVSMDKDGNVIGKGDMGVQVKTVYAEIKSILTRHNTSLKYVIRETVYTTNMDQFLIATKVREQAYASARLPVSSWLGVERLASPDFLVEIQMEVLIPTDKVVKVDTSATDRQRLQDLKSTEWQQAYQSGDARRLEKILHERYELIDPQGNRLTREEELNYVRNSPTGGPRSLYTIERLQLLSDEVALISSHGKTGNYQFRVSDIFVKESGAWRAIASHISELPAVPDLIEE